MKILHANDRVGEHANSWYNASCETTKYTSLTKDCDVDVCVIGAGFTGLACAINLAQSGISVALLDAHRVGWGASGRNGGQLGSGFNKNQQELEQKFGAQIAHKLWLDAQAAKQYVHTLCKQFNIDCDYVPGIISAMHKERFVAPLHRYCKKLNDEYHYPEIQALSKQDLGALVNTQAYCGGSIDYGAGHIHPLKLAVGMAKAAHNVGVAIHESSEVTKIERTSANSGSPSSFKVISNGVQVSAQQVVLACNGYLDGLHSGVQKRVMPINNFIIATEPLGKLASSLLPQNHAVADSRFVVNYFRLSKDNRLLFGGGENYRYTFPKDITKIASKPMLEIFPQLSQTRIDYAWGGTLAITQSRLPFVQQVESNMYAACGYSGHGVALSSYCGRAIAEAIVGRTELFERLATFPTSLFPGTGLVRSTALAAAMTWYSFRDRF